MTCCNRTLSCSTPREIEEPGSPTLLEVGESGDTARGRHVRCIWCFCFEAWNLW